MVAPYSNQLLEVKDMAFRLLWKTKAGTFDLVVFTGTGTQNVRVAGIIDVNTPGYAHFELRVPSADCVITTLNDTAININNSCGYYLFEYKDINSDYQLAYVQIVDFLQESDNNDYRIFFNGITSRQQLPPLYN